MEKEELNFVDKDGFKKADETLKNGYVGEYTPHREEHTEWEKEFDARFARGFHNGDWVLFYCPTSDQKDEHPATEDDVKSFIHSLLKDQRERIRREVDEALFLGADAEYIINLPSLQD